MTPGAVRRGAVLVETLIVLQGVVLALFWSHLRIIKTVVHRLDDEQGRRVTYRGAIGWRP